MLSPKADAFRGLWRGVISALPWLILWPRRLELNIVVSEFRSRIMRQ